MLLALTPAPVDPQGSAAGRWRVRELSDAPAAPRVVDVGGLAELERGGPRWVLDSTARDYPSLLAAGIRLGRCHDVTLTERILLARAGRFAEPSAATAVRARSAGLPVPIDAPLPIRGGQPTLFGAVVDGPGAIDPLDELAVAWRDQQRRVGADNALRLLVTAESTAGLAAAEMSARGLPWDRAEHDRLLTATLGPRPRAGDRPSVLAELARQIEEAFGHRVNPDSPAEVRSAFHRAGYPIETTRSWELRDLPHPAAPIVVQYKELSRLFSANGWAWVDAWVTGGRLHTEFLPGGVVSGRWATRGGGGLQLPKAIRAAARAEPGYVLVVADAAQLEPRVLAAVSGDQALQEISSGADLYAGIAAAGFGGDRAKAKLAMLGAMYGQTTGEAGRLLATLWSRFPVAMAYVDAAARTGEAGGVVRSVLGRASPPAGGDWQAEQADAAGPDATAGAQRRARARARSWGRFTRNFVVQASAADWANVWLSLLRKELGTVDGAELVFFQHDELVVHAPERHAGLVIELAIETARQARELVFPGSAAQTPVHPVAVRNYTEAK